MISLEERWIRSDIEKSFKYIRKMPDGHGGWRYIYEEPHGKPLTKRFGQVFKEYIGKPQEAFKRLFREKTGHAENVATLKLPTVFIDDSNKISEVRGKNSERVYQKTPIDLVWGNKYAGIKHLLYDHYANEKNFKSIKDAEETVARCLKKFEADPSSFSVEFVERNSTLVLTSKEGERLVIAIEKSKDTNGKDIARWFILTSFYKGHSKKTTNEERKQRIDEIEKWQGLLTCHLLWARGTYRQCLL